MTKKQKMELRNKLRAKFLERIEQRVSSDVENEGLRIMSENLSVYTTEQNDPVLAFIRFGEDWNYAKCDSGIRTLRAIYENFEITNDMMPFRHFVMQYNLMYAAEAVRTINEWRERNGVGVETAY